MAAMPYQKLENDSDQHLALQTLRRSPHDPIAFPLFLAYIQKSQSDEEREEVVVIKENAFGCR